jgi:hypothetical protein
MRQAQDLLHLLARDHRRLDQRARSLLAEPARRTANAVAGFATDVLVHEACEQLLLHPLAAANLRAGALVARQRIDEEASVERHLHWVLREDPASPAFTARFADLHRVLVDHTDREELEVFPALRHVVGRAELRDLGRAYATLGARLPTRLRCTAGDDEGTPAAVCQLARTREVAAELLDELAPPIVVDLPELTVAPPAGRVVSTLGSSLAGRA